MLPVLVHGPRGVLKVLALCDEASTVTLMDDGIAKKLGLHGKTDPLCIQWTNGQTACHDDSEKIDVEISGLQNSMKFALKDVRTVDSLLLPEQTVDMDVWEKYEYLRGLPIHNIINERPMLLLLGQDNVNLTTPRQFRNGPETCPIATRCQLGWSLHGLTPSPAENGKVYIFHVCNINKTEDDLHELIKHSFSIEAFGVCINKRPKPSRDDTRAVHIMESTSKRVGCRFEIGLLWKFEDFKLPESKPTALQRLRCVERKLQKDKNLAEDYCKKINSYLKKGYANKLTPEEAEVETPPVKNPRKPGKMRLVFDAAAKCNGYSLNDFLLSGPDLLQPLISVFWKFRQRKYGICGDVSEMFHQVLIRKSDREAQRFLWRGLDHTRTPDTDEMQVMTFGATCSPVCAQFIKKLNAKEQAPSDKIFKAITQKFYVDDYLDSVDTEEEAVSMINEICRVLKLGGFQIVNWVSNSTAVRRALPETLLEAKMLDSEKGSAQRVLGIWWNSKTDQILVNFNETLTDEKNVTKRKVMKNVMSIFDPLGLIAFCTIRAKIIMQDVWRSGIQWDEKLPNDLEKTWLSWTTDLKEVAKIKIPRCYSPSIHLSNNIQLHLFADASEKAFAVVAYLRVATGFQVNVSLVAAKTRVAPLKPLSVPRMELQAAVMASRLSCSILEHLEVHIQKVNYWTDSKCVLDWIKADGRKYQQFVAHRIGEIQELTNSSDWRWVSSKENIADEATRPTSSTPYGNLFVKWIHGPEFLRQSEEFWPVQKENYSDEYHDPELKKKNEFVALVFHDEEYSYLPKIERFSQCTRLIRATSWLLRFCRILISRVRKQKTDYEKCVSVEEFEMAEQYWIKYSQWQSFREDIILLQNKAPLEGKSRLKQLNAALDGNGLLILKGRTNLSSCMSMQTKEPFILSPHNDYTKLLLQHYHVKFRHQGVETILNEIRLKFWVIDGRDAIKSTFTRCLKCRNKFQDKANHS